MKKMLAIVIAGLFVFGIAAIVCAQSEEKKEGDVSEKQKAMKICKEKGYVGEEYEKCVKITAGGDESAEAKKKKAEGTGDEYILRKEKAIKICTAKGFEGDALHACIADELGIPLKKKAE